MKQIFVILIIFPVLLLAQDMKTIDVWKPFKAFIGVWEGTGTGMGGSSKIQTGFRFVLDDNYIEVKNRAVFEPTEKNPDGEIHEDWGMISYDKARGVFVLREFHTEGYVNQYVLKNSLLGDKTLIFESEIIENFVPGGRVRQTYHFNQAGELKSTFDVSFPGKEFGCFGENTLKRKK